MPHELDAEIATLRDNVATLRAALAKAKPSAVVPLLGELRRTTATLARLVLDQHRLDHPQGNAGGDALAALRAALDDLEADGLGLAGKPITPKTP